VILGALTRMSSVDLFLAGLVLEYPMDENYLAQRFCSLWQDCAGAEPEQVWASLRQHYQEPHRCYHTLGHLAHCLGELDQAKAHVEEFKASEMAIWFHDIIYTYGSRDNELRSAEYFGELATSAMSAQFTDRVCEFIVATQHAGAASDSSVAFVVDIDLSGFGLPWEKYQADSDALRHEADSIDDEQYFQGKLRFLSELQQWPSLFQTEYFSDRLEAVAQANIARYISELRAQGFGGTSAICRA
jgi:predicted metal-dependent HD superfamily phosphohydrolase